MKDICFEDKIRDFLNAKDICFLEEKEILTVDRKYLLYSINLKVMLTEELKRYKKKLVEL